MNLLAFDTSTESLSIAVAWDAAGRARALERTGAGGPQASGALIPGVLALLAEAGLRLADLDAIVFGSGPGSFTGLRTACSVAQGLAFGASVPVLPVETLQAVAEQAREQQGAQRVVALLDARMGEVYAGAYAFSEGLWRREGDITLGPPEAVRVPPGWALAGNAFAAYGHRLPQAAARIDALPQAAALLRLAPALLAAGRAVDAAAALPLYIRDKVAQTTDERAAQRAAAASSP